MFFTLKIINNFLLMHRYKILIEFQGSFFSGWQKQNNAYTAQEALEKSLYQLTKTNISTHSAGRTDAGVHAIAMPAHFDLPKYYDPIRVQHALNFFLKKEPISVFQVEYLGENSNFHARFSATARTYVYKLIQRNYPLTWQKDLYWWITQNLDITLMQQAANYLIGTHDFSSFRAQGCQANSPIRTIEGIDIQENTVDNNTNEIIITIKGQSFLYHQVRNIVGSIYYVGIKKWTVSEFYDIFLAQDRALAGPTAPACGLYFLNATY